MTETKRKNKAIWYVLIAILSILLIAAVIAAFFADELITFIKPVHETVVYEAGADDFAVDLFKRNETLEITILSDTSVIDLSKIGEHTIELSDGWRNFTSTLRIIDTTPPTATAVSKQIYTFETVTAEELVKDIKDVSAVQVEFAQDPPFGTAGNHTVTVILTDKSGNTNRVNVSLSIIKDPVPPVFSEMEDLVVQLGNAISYKKGVVLTDNRDESVAFTVDSSLVDTEKIGTYQVTYTATDSDGNTATAIRNVIIQEKPVIELELVETMAKEVLDEIITESMSDHEKIKTIFNWVKRNMTYVSSPETDIPNAAYVAFTTKRGDCYNYFSMTKLLLDGCGIQNMMIERAGGSSTHYWHLVNIGSGWYHYDTTPQHHLYPYSCFMKTDEEVWEYANSRGDGRTDYYNFDETLYPERATEKYSG